MSPNRRAFLRRVALSGAAIQGLAYGSHAALKPVKAVAFDAFPILDPRPVFALAEELYPERGAELGNLWRTRQFEYTWLRTLSGRYADFRQVTDDALTFAAKALKLELTPEKHARLMQSYFELRCWPDAPDALATLRKAGVRLAFLSNMTGRMLETGLRNSRLSNSIDSILSTDRVQAFKPDPRAYRMGVEALGLTPPEIVFAAFAGWDACGAKAFGYRTFWVNRQNQPAEQLGSAPDGTGVNLKDLVNFVLA